MKKTSMQGSMSVILLIASLLPISAHAQNLVKNVIGLDQETCWTQRTVAPADNKWEWKIAAFRDQTAYSLKEETWGSFLKRKLPKNLETLVASYPESAYDLFIRCGTGRHELVMNLHEKNPKLCISLSGGNLGIKEVLSNHKAVAGDHCWGQTPLQLIIGLKNGTDINQFDADLRAGHPDAIVNTSYTAFSPVIFVELAEKYRFVENQAKALFEADGSLSSRMEFVEYDESFTLTPAVQKLHNGTFQGY